MIAFGWHKVRQGALRLGVAIQGGGFAILYLDRSLHAGPLPPLGPTPSFALFAILGIACVLTRCRPGWRGTGGVRWSGAFAAPVLASTGSGDPAGLFGYFALLNAFIVGVSWFRGLAALNVTGFLFTPRCRRSLGPRSLPRRHHDVRQGFPGFFRGFTPRRRSS